MAIATRGRTRSFSRNTLSGPTSQVPGLKPGPNGALFLSSGIPDLDRILGGGFCLGSLIMVMEAPHHMLLLRNFMAQGLVHNQPLLYASPLKDPKGFLGTLPNPMSPKDDKPRDHGSELGKDLRIAWEYKKYAVESQLSAEIKEVEVVSLVVAGLLYNHYVLLSVDTLTRTGREMLAFIKSLKAFARASNAVAVITFPPSLLPHSFSKTWQHLADTLTSVKAIPDEDKELAQLLTGYQEMIGFLSIHKVARFNTQVPLV